MLRHEDIISKTPFIKNKNSLIPCVILLEFYICILYIILESPGEYVKKNIRIISALIVSVTFVNFSFANYIFEAEIGRYKPNDSDFGGDASLRLGAVLANDFGPIEVYGGY